MRVTFSLFLSILLGASTAGLAGEQRPNPAPAELNPALENRGHSVVEHLRLAAEELDALGMKDEAARVRSSSQEISRRAQWELEELSKQISELQKKAVRLNSLIERKRPFVIACQIVEVSGSAVTTWQKILADAQRIDAVLSVHSNAEELLRKLDETGGAKVLGRPQIRTIDGQEATVMIGAQFPIPIPTEEDKSSVEWREFGTRFRCVPHLIDGTKVRIEFSAEVSERDFQNAVVVAGQSVPGLKTSRVVKETQLPLGQTLVVSLASKIKLSDGKEAALNEDGAENDEKSTLFILTPALMQP